MTDIVWAEDSSADQFLIQSVLERMEPQVKVAFAEDGDVAVRLALEHRPPVIVLDLKMPRVDGLEALRRLRRDATTSASDIIVFSSTGQPEEVDAIRSLGASGFVQKPIDYEGFSVAVRSIARKAATLSVERRRGTSAPRMHHVMFAESDRAMLDTGVRFLREARRSGRGLVVIAARQHVARLRAELGDADAVWVEAEDAKKRVYRDGAFDLDLFQGMVAEAYGRASQGGQRPIAWFGQLVDVLHAQGLGDDALCIERYIQRAAADAGDRMDILCAYSLDGMTPEARAATAATHTDTW